MDGLIHTSLIIVASITSAFVINSDFAQYKKRRKLTMFTASLGILIAIAVLLTITYALKKQDATASVLYAVSATQGLSNASLDFRQNNTYKLANNHFTSTDYSRGRYSLIDSIIYLERPDPSGTLISRRLLLRTFKRDSTIKRNGLLTLILGEKQVDSNAETFLLQINDSGQPIQSALIFKVTEKF
jgi:hypothetical protein